MSIATSVRNGIAADLEAQNLEHGVGHITRLLERESARLAPSKIECPTKAARAYIKDHELVTVALADLHAKMGLDDIDKWVKANQALIAEGREEFDGDTLLLFRTGRFWEDILARGILHKYGAAALGMATPWATNDPGRELVLDNGAWRGMVDTVTGTEDAVTLWEIKSTKLYNLKKFTPQQGHLAQLWVYTQLYEEIYGYPVAGANLVYVPNDLHAKGNRRERSVLDNIKVYRLSEQGGQDDWQDWREAAETMIAEYGSRSPGPYYAGVNWPCKAGSYTCPEYAACFGGDASDDDIPF